MSDVLFELDRVLVSKMVNHHHHHHHSHYSHHHDRYFYHHHHLWQAVLFICTFLHIAHASLRVNYVKLSHGPQSQSVFTEGKRVPDDRLIFNDSIITHSVFTTASVRNVHYPPKHKSGYKLSYIQVIDKTGSTSRVLISHGGIGYRHVTMRLISHQNRGLDYSIKLYTDEPMYYRDGVEVPGHMIESIKGDDGTINGHPNFGLA